MGAGMQALMQSGISSCMAANAAVFAHAKQSRSANTDASTFLLAARHRHSHILHSRLSGAVAQGSHVGARMQGLASYTQDASHRSQIGLIGPAVHLDLVASPPPRQRTADVMSSSWPPGV